MGTGAAAWQSGDGEELGEGPRRDRGEDHARMTESLDHVGTVTRWGGMRRSSWTPRAEAVEDYRVYGWWLNPRWV